MLAYVTFNLTYYSYDNMHITLPYAIYNIIILCCIMMYYVSENKKEDTGTVYKKMKFSVFGSLRFW